MILFSRIHRFAGPISRAGFPEAFSKALRLLVFTAGVLAGRHADLAAGSHLNLPSPAPEYLLSRWSSDDGLPQNSIISMAQTADGYIWVSTFGGLARFDGLRFEVFDGDMVPELAGEYFTTLRGDRFGNLWLHSELTRGGRKSLILGTNGRFRAIGEADGLPPSGVEAIEVGSDGSLLIGDATGRLLRFDGSRFQVLAADPPAPDWGPLGHMTPDRFGRLWAQSATALALYENGRWRVIYEGRRDCAMLPLHDGGLLIVDDNCHRLQRFERGELREIGRIPGGFVGHFVRQDSEGNIWFTAASGVLRFDTAGRWTHLTPEDGLVVDTVRSEMADREGNYWLGTDGAGLVRLKRRAIKSAGLAEGLTKRIVLSLSGDGEGGLWAAVLTGGLNHYDGRRFSPLPEPLLSRSGPLAWCVHPARDGGVWWGTYGSGLMRLDASRQTLSEYSRATHPEMINGPVFALLEDRSGVVWAGGPGGLARLADGRFQAWSTTNGLPDDQVNAIAEDRSGTIWIGTRKGAVRLSADGLKTFTTADGLSHDNIRTVFCDGDGDVWLGGRGITRFRNGKFSPIRGTDGLPVEVVKSILDDDHGCLWLTTPHGVLRAEKRMLHDFCEGHRAGVVFSVFDKTDGLPSDECSGYQPASWKNPDGRLYFPTLDGVAVVDPKALPRNTRPPPVIIESVTADERRIWAGGTDRLDIAAGTARVELRYTALSFTASGRNRFRYRLENFDRDWRDAGVERVATYTRLPPGQYAFRVLGSNSDGVWNETGATLAVRVLPAWWQMTWFRSAMIVAAFGAAFAAYAARIGALTRARELQERFARDLIASQEAERQRIARELHDSLGQNLLVIKSRVAMAQQCAEQPEKLGEQLGAAASMTSQAIREVREISQNLRPFQLDELGLTKAVGAMVRKLAEASPVRFHTDIAELRGAFPAEAEIHFYRVLQECLNNVVKHSGATECRLAVHRENSLVRATVVDDGRGMPPDDPQAGGGFGMRTIRERVRMLRGTVDFVSRPGEGTRVIVSVPLDA